MCTVSKKMLLVFLTTCCSRSSLKLARPLCDGRPFASPLFRRLAGRGSFFRGFPFRWALQFVFSLVRCVTLQDAAPRQREDSLFECGRPHDTLSCLFFTALWLRQSQSISTMSILLATRRCRPSLSRAYKWGPCPLSGQWLYLQDLINPALHLPMKVHFDEHPGDARPAPPHPRWRRDALQPPLIQRATLEHMCPYS